MIAPKLIIEPLQIHNFTNNISKIIKFQDIFTKNTGKRSRSCLSTGEDKKTWTSARTKSQHPKESEHVEIESDQDKQAPLSNHCPNFQPMAERSKPQVNRFMDGLSSTHAVLLTMRR